MSVEAELLESVGYTPIQRMRHSAAHVMAEAVVEIFPDAKLAIGPAIEDGFYYDFDLSRALTPAYVARYRATYAAHRRLLKICYRWRMRFSCMMLCTFTRNMSGILACANGSKFQDDSCFYTASGIHEMMATS